MSRSNYQRGVEPWETSQTGGRQPREGREAPPKTDRQRRKARERRYQWLLFVMFLLPLGAGIAHLFLEGVPFSLLSTFSAVLRIEYLKTNGLFYTIFQVGSALSCMAAWMAIRAPIAYPIGLLTLPVLLMLGWILLSLKQEFGYKLMMTVLVLTEVITGLILLVSCFVALFTANIANTLLQIAFYVCLFLYPLFELIVLRKWKENIY